MKTITTLINEIDQRDCDNYQGFLSDIRSNFNKMVSDGNTPVFGKIEIEQKGAKM